MTSGDEVLILAIETAIGGGSLALSRGGEIISTLEGGPDTSRASGLLPAIDELLKGSDLKPRDLNRIAVSVGPGSYTGIRVGIATALGLARSVGIEVAGVSALRALAAAGDLQTSVIAVLPVGREDIAWQHFDGDTTTAEPRVGSLDSLARYLDGSGRHDTIVRHIGLVERLAEFTPPLNVTAAEVPLAALIALAAHNGLAEPGLAPLYLLNPARGRNLF